MQAQTKRALGQYFTSGNPFHTPAFAAWMRGFWSARQTLLDPFAGKNSLLRLVREAGWEAEWVCFDKDPPPGAPEGVKVIRQDTLIDFPHGYVAAITNPPYLARFSATRRGLVFPSTASTLHDDLYKVALSQMLAHVPHVAAIVPQSFLNSGLFHERLNAVVSLTQRMFDDTETPVCLALFGSTPSSDFEVWDVNKFLGTYKDLCAMLPTPSVCHPWRFNVPEGTLALYAVDSRLGPSIRFMRGECVEASRVSNASRAITRIGGASPGTEDAIIVSANERLAKYRAATHDTLLMAFRGLRKDGGYRRRLDFVQARRLLNLAAADLKV